ncbi:hypothetical protein GCM10025868_37410 [Angustibacter aerolatus]|uniref:UvrD-like helicase ATP-binding domain-containing protein n=1 Tax=Angustibacter aerolatus TaxID=1162965 RepID=A0ABQ6JPA5_9ACTN|nr:UvrD-helicase domain-containing protein [Angustibacter aerolatus]GMA88491.1 hypothetical protein GCM10025868_37410 [Angustibacter aerolatus]
MLHALFGDGHAVTAVGDPNQSIYGWRGASAGTLATFADRFRDVDGGPATVRRASTSWRNDRAVLEVANRLAAPLREGADVEVHPLVARPGAGSGHAEPRDVPDLAGSRPAGRSTGWRSGGSGPTAGRCPGAARRCCAAGGRSSRTSRRRCCDVGCPTRWSGSAGCSRRRRSPTC